MRERLLQFIDQMRQAGIRVSVAESLDAANAVATAGLARTPFREALSATLIKDESDRPAFERLFDSFYRGSHGRQERDERPQKSQQNYGTGGSQSDAGQRKLREAKPGTIARLKADDAKKMSTQGEEQREDDDAESSMSRSSEPSSPAENEQSSEGGILSRRKAVELKNFTEYSDLDYDQAYEALALLRRRFQVRLGRRLRTAKRGRLDFRRTIRAASQRGGTLIDLRFRARRPSHFDLLILADVSGSVRYCSELLLGLMAGAERFFRKKHSFVFIDRLAEASFEQGHLVMTPPLDLYARSDFGRVLKDLWLHKRELLTRGTVLVIMGDGRNNRRPARSDLLRSIARCCRTAIWLIPEDASRWGTGDSAINIYARAVTAMVPCPNLHELEKALARVA